MHIIKSEYTSDFVSNSFLFVEFQVLEALHLTPQFLSEQELKANFQT